MSDSVAAATTAIHSVGRAVWLAVAALRRVGGGARSRRAGQRLLLAGRRDGGGRGGGRAWPQRQLLFLDFLDDTRAPLGLPGPLVTFLLTSCREKPEKKNKRGEEAFVSS